MKTLPKFLDLKPLRIDYTIKRKTAGGARSPSAKGDAQSHMMKKLSPEEEERVWALGEVNPKFEAQEGFSKR